MSVTMDDWRSSDSHERVYGGKAWSRKDSRIPRPGLAGYSGDLASSGGFEGDGWTSQSKVLVLIDD